MGASESTDIQKRLIESKEAEFNDLRNKSEQMQQELTTQKELLDGKVANIDHTLEIMEREQIRLKCMYKDLYDKVSFLEKHEDEMVTKSKKAKIEEERLEAIRQKVRVEEEERIRYRRRMY